MTKSSHHRKTPARKPDLRHAPHTGLRVEAPARRESLYLMSNGIEVSGERNARAYLQARPEVRAVLASQAPPSGPRYQTEVRLRGHTRFLTFTPLPYLG